VRGLRAGKVEELKAAIAALERRPALAADSAQLPARPGGEPTPLELFAAPAGLLHEIFLDDPRAAGTGLGFSLALARTLLTPVRQAILCLELSSQTQELGFPYAPGFAAFGLAPDSIVLCRLETMTELLWAMEEAIGCRAVAAVIADVPGHEKDLDFTVSRRLSMRAASAGASALLLRYGRAREASAAKLRWRIAPAISATRQFDATSPGPPRFAVTLEKSRLGARAQKLEGQSFSLDWLDHGFAPVERGRGRDAAGAGQPAAPRPQPAVLGDRFSEAS
jgi:protein ImuA